MLKTILSDISKSGITPFQFAGFNFPKHVWTLPLGQIKKRLADRKARYSNGGYYHAPQPVKGAHFRR